MYLNTVRSYIFGRCFNYMHLLASWFLVIGTLYNSRIYHAALYTIV